MTGSTMKAKCALYYGNNETLVPNSETNEITWTNVVNAAWYDFDYTGRTPPSVTAGVTYNIVVWASTSGGSTYSINMAFDSQIFLTPHPMELPKAYHIAPLFQVACSLLSTLPTSIQFTLHMFLIRLRIILGDVVQLTAVPAAGWSFSGWSGDLSGSVNPILSLWMVTRRLLLLSLRIRSVYFDC